MNLNALWANLDASALSLALMAVIVIAVVTSWHRHKEGFDLSQCIVDSATGKVSPEKIGYMTVLALMSWGFVALTLKGLMTEWYAGLYAGIFVMGRIGYKYADAKAGAPNVV